MKGKKYANSSSLSKEYLENIEFLSFLQEDFLPKQVYKDSKNKPLVDTKELLIHVCAQYKSLLELPPINFWSTVAHNAYLNRSLDSFLSFARRWHFGIIDVPTSDELAASQDFDVSLIQSKKQLEPYYNELYRTVLFIYYRMATEHRSGENINFGEIIYDEWMFDIAKLLDICAIYQYSNPDKVKIIVQNVFSLNKAYYDDFAELISLLLEDLIPNNMKILNRHRVRSDLDAGTLKSDTAEKEKILVLLYDIFEHLKFVVHFFPKGFCEELFYNKDFFFVLENTYMMLTECAKSWRVLEFKVDAFKALVVKIKDEIINISETIFNYVFADIFTGKTTILKNKKPWKRFSDILAITGKTTAKKKDEEPNYKFLRRLLTKVDLNQILSKTPEGFIKQEDLEIYQVVFMVSKEKTETLLNKRKPKEEIGFTDENNQISKEVLLENQIEQSTTQENKEIKPEKVEEIDKESKETQEAIRIIEMTIGKK